MKNMSIGVERINHFYEWLLSRYLWRVLCRSDL